MLSKMMEEDSRLSGLSWLKMSKGCQVLLIKNNRNQTTDAFEINFIKKEKLN